jgi:hypothetical protein
MSEIQDERFRERLRAIEPSPIQPDPEDYDAVEAVYGTIPPDSPDEVCGDRYRLVQAEKLIRLWKRWKASQN